MKFYQELGFRFLARVAGYYDRREAAVIMARSLTGCR
jgi:ribosomal protein S18 acetylase RimI-like enzyme